MSSRSADPRFSSRRSRRRVPGIGHDPRLLGEQPGQGDLADRGVLALGHAGDEVDEGEVGLEGLTLEPGQRRADVPLAELGGRR